MIIKMTYPMSLCIFLCTTKTSHYYLLLLPRFLFCLRFLLCFLFRFLSRFVFFLRPWLWDVVAILSACVVGNRNRGPGLWNAEKIEDLADCVDTGSWDGLWVDSAVGDGDMIFWYAVKGAAFFSWLFGNDGSTGLHFGAFDVHSPHFVHTSVPLPRSSYPWLQE